MRIRHTLTKKKNNYDRLKIFNKNDIILSPLTRVAKVRFDFLLHRLSLFRGHVHRVRVKK